MDIELRMHASAEDAPLVRRARAGDRDAFDSLVRGHFARVYALLFRMVGNHEDAEDLAQQCFVRAWDSLAWYRAEGGFAAWVYRIALHLARDHQRKRGRGPGTVALDSLPAEPPSGGREPGDELAGRELSRRVSDALLRLPHRQRAALVLRVFEGRDYDEVARVIGIARGTARLYVMKARKHLLAWLESERRAGDDTGGGA
jgi:RNA polymerase sigma-70 factor (ECF subfamily)